MTRKKIGRICPDRERNGLTRAVTDFNEHVGPARVYYVRTSGVFSTVVYPDGAESYWGDMFDSPEKVEIYRKTTSGGATTTSAQELAGMADAVRPFSYA